MKIAIHHREGSFSERWIEYCEKENIQFKIVNCYDSNIIEQLKDCDALMWHHSHGNYKDLIFAKELLFALEHTGIKTFPNFNTGWHFDDKVGQKYLLEANKLPFINSYIFYDKKTAIHWANSTIFPKVFKLRGGAGSTNVKLVNTKKECNKLIKKAFNGKGNNEFNTYQAIKDYFGKFRETKQLSYIVKAIGVTFLKPNARKLLNKDIGYVYFQDFIPKNYSDTRVIVIGNRAFAIKRLVRENDFRASGSGKIIYDKNEINLSCVNLSFHVAQKIKSHCIAIDFVFNDNNNPLIIEISYGFSADAYKKCPGYWDTDLNWHNEPVKPEDFIIEDLINNYKSSK